MNTSLLFKNAMLRLYQQKIYTVDYAILKASDYADKNKLTAEDYEELLTYLASEQEKAMQQEVVEEESVENTETTEDTEIVKDTEIIKDIEVVENNETEETVEDTETEEG